MKRVCIFLNVGMAAATPALAADPLSFEATPLAAPVLSLRESLAEGGLLAETLAARKDRFRPRVPLGSRQNGTGPRAPGRMPIIEPDPTTDFHLLVKTPDASVDYKMLQRESTADGNARR